MKNSDIRTDERVKEVRFSGGDELCVSLMDGRRICVPTAWFPKLLNKDEKKLENWEICGAGFGIHWPELDEHLSTEGLLRGAPAAGL